MQRCSGNRRMVLDLFAMIHAAGGQPRLRFCVRLEVCAVAGRLQARR
jgi:hypothetical protein